MNSAESGELVVTRTGETFLIRYANASDEPLVKALLEHESVDDIRFRFFVSLRNFDREFLRELLSVGDKRATPVIAIDPRDGCAAGLACLHQEGDTPLAEFAILVRSDLKSHGVGYRLMERLITEARAKRYERIEGFVLWENVAMRTFCRSLGFRFVAVQGDPMLTSAVMELANFDGPPHDCVRSRQADGHALPTV